MDQPDKAADTASPHENVTRAPVPPPAGASPGQRLWNPRAICQALRHGLQGLRDAWRHEAAFRREVACAPVLVPMALILGRNWLESAVLLLSLGLVVVAELLNTAIEAAIDRIGPERHELSRMAKDVGAGAVVVSITLVAIIWAMAFFHWWTVPR